MSKSTSFFSFVFRKPIKLIKVFKGKESGLF